MTKGTITSRDWTQGPGMWFAVGVICTLCAVSLVWTVVNNPRPLQPTVVTEQGVRRQTPHQPQDVRNDIPAGTTSIVRERTQYREDVPAEDAAIPAKTVRSTGVNESAHDAFARLRIDLNTASAAELELLPGIGPTLAARILFDRQQHGAFSSIEDLDRVRGIGEKMIEKIRPFATVRGETPEPGGG